MDEEIKTPKKRRGRRAAEPEVADVITEVQSEAVEDAVTEPVEEVETIAEVTPVTDIDTPEVAEVVESIAEITECEAVSEPTVAEATPKEVKKPKAPKKSKTEAKVSKDTRNISKLTWLYPTAVAAKATRAITGEVYIWDPAEYNGRVRVTKEKSGIGNIAYLAGWVDVSALD